MARLLTWSAGNVTPKGQPSRMTCWLTAYEMLFNSGGMYAKTQYDIERILKDGGFNPGTSKDNGISDEDFVQVSEILGTGTLLPGQLCGIGGLSRNLNNYGVLWVALQIPINQKKPDGPRYRHIVIVVGVDEERGQVGIINPWKENAADIPCVVWLDWSWFKNGIRHTESVDAGCQYFKKQTARAGA